MDQSSRIAELDRFKAGTINILVASDVAARGLDIKGVSHVFNFDTPWHPDDYVHRIGRTGRAGATGRAFTLVTPEDAEAIANVEKLTGGEIPLFETQFDGRDDERPAREERGEERSRRARGPRREGTVAEDRPARPARQVRPEREARPAREPRPPREAKSERTPRPERAAQRGRAAPPAGGEATAEDWNGPIPGFLNFKAS